jgi:hypothetical protein
MDDPNIAKQLPENFHNLQNQKGEPVIEDR